MQAIVDLLGMAMLLGVVVSVPLVPLMRSWLRNRVHASSFRSGCLGLLFFWRHWSDVIPRRSSGNPGELTVEFASPQKQSATRLMRRAQRLRAATVSVYAIAGVASAAVLTFADAKIGHARAFASALVNVWPVVLVVVILSMNASWRRLAVLFAAFVTFLMLSAALGITQSWILAIAAPTAFALFTFFRYMATLAPMIMIASVFGLPAGFFLFGIVKPSEAWAVIGVVLVTIAIVLVFIAILGKLYERKWLSDASFQVAFLWLIFVFHSVRDRADSHWSAVLIAFAIYVLSVNLLMVFVRERLKPPVALMVLRVFGAPGRAHRLFEALGTRWRHLGPINLIAGTDSVIANLDLGEAARALTPFRFGSLYIHNERDLDEQKVDDKPDFDARYRVNDFFCTSKVWKAAFERLIGETDTILVDLSGYTRKRKGIQHELETILETRAIDDCVFFVADGLLGERTDRESLEQKLRTVWKMLDESSPNFGRSVTLRILDRPSPDQLFNALCNAAEANTAGAQLTGAEVPATA